MIALHIAMKARLRAKEKQIIAKHGREALSPPPISQRLHFRMYGTHKPRARA